MVEFLGGCLPSVSSVGGKSRGRKPAFQPSNCLHSFHKQGMCFCGGSMSCFWVRVWLISFTLSYSWVFRSKRSRDWKVGSAKRNVSSSMRSVELASAMQSRETLQA